MISSSSPAAAAASTACCSRGRPPRSRSCLGCPSLDEVPPASTMPEITGPQYAGRSKSSHPLQRGDFVPLFLEPGDQLLDVVRPPQLHLDRHVDVAEAGVQDAFTA